MNVIVLGASNKPDRFSYKAVDQLLQAGHTVFPVHPIIKEYHYVICSRSKIYLPNGRNPNHEPSSPHF